MQPLAADLRARLRRTLGEALTPCWAGIQGSLRRGRRRYVHSRGA
ncbi:MAG: hypothetical protein R2911_39185 [Caldilineaceae bacterium]